MSKHLLSSKFRTIFSILFIANILLVSIFSCLSGSNSDLSYEYPSTNGSQKGKAVKGLFSPSQQGSAPWDLIDSLNGYRAANGLAGLRVNDQLMAAAQAQADFLAATYDINSGADGHEGAGGSRPIDRAYAFGYGSGKAIDVSENWAGLGPDTSVSQVVYNPWWADSAHQNTMLDGWGVNYTDVGTGVATSGLITYYVIDVGTVDGNSAYIPPSGNGGVFPGGDSAQPVFVPLQTALPAPDGSLTHVVKEGQNLITIALSYGVKVDDIRRLNGMAEGWVMIWPDQNLIIRPAGSAGNTTQSVTETPLSTQSTPTMAPTYTPRPRSTRTPMPTFVITQVQNGSDAPIKSEFPIQTLGLILIILCGAGLLGFIIFSSKNKS